MYRIPAVALVLALALPVAAAEKYDPTARAQAIAPFVEAQTVGVAHVDLTRIDAEAILDKVAEMGKVEANEIAGTKHELRGWLAELRRGGARDLYVVFSLADLPAGPPIVIVPLVAGADAQVIARELSRGKLFAPLHAETLGQVVVAASENTLKRLRTLEPTPRPELVKAFTAAGATAVQVLLLPTNDTRRVIDELLPTLPPEIGGAPSQVLTHCLRWAALGVDPPPKLALRLVIQSADPAAAEKLAGLLAKAREALEKQKEVRELLPDLARVGALLTLMVEGDRLIIALGDKELLALVPPLVQRALQVADRNTATNNLRQIVEGMHGYADANKSRFLAVANFDNRGKPLLSWRVHLLPFVGEQKLYKEFHLDEPWDSAHNKELVARMPQIYGGPNRKLNREGMTTYLAPVSKDTAFTGGPQGLRLPQDFPDGTSNTILLVEGDDEHAVIWTRPADLKYDPEQPQQGLGGHFAGGFLVALVDGSVRFVPKTISKKTLHAAFTRNGGEVLGPDW